MAIYEINGARYEIDDTNLTKQQLDGAIEEIAAQPRDSALGYSVDQLQMAGAADPELLPKLQAHISTVESTVASLSDREDDTDSSITALWYDF